MYISYTFNIGTALVGCYLYGTVNIVVVGDLGHTKRD